MKGVSPVVATILMIAIAIAAAVIAYSWLTSWQQSQQTKVSATTFYNLALSGVYCRNNDLVLSVMNSGKEDVNLPAKVFVYQDDTLQDTADVQIYVKAGESNTVTVANKCPGSSGTYTIKLVHGSLTLVSTLQK